MVILLWILLRYIRNGMKMLFYHHKGTKGHKDVELQTFVFLRVLCGKKNYKNGMSFTVE